MQGYLLMDKAAAPTVAVIGNIGRDQLAAATPCTEFDVRRLIEHLLFWGPALEGAAHKEDPTRTGSEWVPQPVGGDLRDPRSALVTQIDRIAAAWSEPAAWDGQTRMGNPMELPASMIGGMVLGEFVVHGWDLARATDQTPSWDDHVLTFVHRELAATAEQGREMGLYGAQVPVPDSAPLLDKILGLTGRDPSWVPSLPAPVV